MLCLVLSCINMSASNLRHMLPTDAILQGWTTIDEAREWVGMQKDVFEAVLEGLGSRKLASPVLFGGIDPIVLKHVAEAAVVDDDERGERPLTPIERTQLNLVYNSIRCKFRQDCFDILSGPVQPAAPGIPAGPVAAGPGGGAGVSGASGTINPLMKVCMRTVLDQACDGEVEALSLKELEDCRAHYRAVVGADPPKDQTPSDNQLSALCRKLEMGLVPFADFSVWKMYGNRSERELKFRVQMREVGGGLRPVEVSGPSSFEAWEQSWLVYKAACIALKAATAHTLDLYSSKIKELAREYPQSWYLLMKADCIMRSEEWQHERRKQERAYALAPMLSEYNPGMPWESVIRSAAELEVFWVKQFEKPAARAEVNKELQAPAFRNREGEGNYEAMNEKNKNRGNPYEGGKKGGKDRGKGKEKEKGNARKTEGRRGDGRYFNSVNGKEICFQWTRNADGCKAVCPSGRAHICEWCRGNHRSIDCPDKPSAEASVEVRKRK